MIIRKASEEDSPAICSLSRQLGYDYPQERIEEKLKSLTTRDDHCIFVALNRESHRVIGYAHAQIYDVLFHDRVLNLLGIVVDESFRSGGAGSLLLEELEKFSREKGCSGIRVNSGSHRTGAHHFYRKNGFHDEKEQKRFFREVREEI
ncbi:MAG: GNAT family N-acetyltransferase [Spirochaetales bacterium]|nr:GNAT family N-acetyltransferase [Spirochaetales bacterium]